MEKTTTLQHSDGVNLDGLLETESGNIMQAFGFAVRPRRPISADDIAAALELHAAPFRIGDAIKLGFKLTCWRDLMPNTPAWQAWLGYFLPQVSYDEAQTLCRLYENFWDGGQWHRLYDGNASCVADAYKQLTAARKRLQESSGEKREYTKRRKCAECRSLFVPKRKDARFCSAKCRQRAVRKAERAQPVTDRKNAVREAASRLDPQTAKNTQSVFSDIHSFRSLSVTKELVLEGGAL